MCDSDNYFVFESDSESDMEHQQEREQEREQAEEQEREAMREFMISLEKQDKKFDMTERATELPKCEEFNPDDPPPRPCFRPQIVYVLPASEAEQKTTERKPVEYHFSFLEYNADFRKQVQKQAEKKAAQAERERQAAKQQMTETECKHGIKCIMKKCSFKHPVGSTLASRIQLSKQSSKR
jgi:hypothetical protein